MSTAKVTVNGNTILDLTDATATADKILAPYTAYGADGSKLVGTATSASGVGYVYSDLNGEAPVDVSQYQYVSVDFAPVRDNKLRYWIDLDASDLTFQAPCTVGTAYSVRHTGMIDWGDGSEQTAYDYNNQTHIHTYPAPGRYCLSMWWTGGEEYFCAKNNLRTEDKPKVIALELFFINYPTNNAGGGLSNVRKIRYSSAQTTVSFNQYTNLTDVILPDTVTTIGNCSQCYSLEKLVIPASVTTIASGGLSNNTAMKEYHFLPTTPPSISSNTFSNIPSNCVIYVPTASLSAYQTATNWSTYASYMVGE